MFHKYMFYLSNNLNYSNFFYSYTVVAVMYRAAKLHILSNTTSKMDKKQHFSMKSVRYTNVLKKTSTVKFF